ncbi:rCG62125 [Rattus norvegicus]|uniref:RCG62125 n=1 Tax=Rattus norvegicus TaxID=10116 RepID=A6HBI9_RAT|nr:rCG62125 [Rattus norvegicus]
MTCYICDRRASNQWVNYRTDFIELFYPQPQQDLD